MQLLKSIFCLQGFDNRTRFFAISSAIYIIFIMLASAFTGKIIVSVIIALLFSAALGLTSLRRLNDAKLNKKWLYAPSVSFALIALVIIFTEHHGSYYLLLLPALFSAILLTYSSKIESSKQEYTLGYIGPVDMSEYQQSSHQGKSAKYRIEPSIAGENVMNIDAQQQEALSAEYSFQQTNQHNSHVNDQQSDIGELIRLKLLSNKKAQITIIAILAVILSGVIISWLISFFSNSTLPEITQDPIAEAHAQSVVITREHPLEMPDNFTLYLSQHQGLIINWQADDNNSQQLWSQLSGQGDKSCQEISFNKGNPVRTLNVDIESVNGTNSNYFAVFSPLDTEVLIQALAFRGKFSLCGYDFSLKGSQAALGKNEHYANWVSY